MSEVVTEYSEFLESTPIHWNRVKIQDVGRIVSGGTPSRDAPSLWNGGIPWVTPGELTSLPTKEIHETAETISAAGLSGSGANLLPAKSLLITSRATLGARAVNSVPMATNQGFKSLVPFNKQTTDFLYHLVDKIKPEMVRRASGTTFLEISGSEFADIDLSMPPSGEAVKIAEILDTLDAAIRGTEAVVAKLKAMKQGLLHDLLTRGIDANGDLRPPHPEAPHLYKETPLGWLPKEWDAVELDSVVENRRPVVYGILMPGHHYEGGVPVVKVRDIIGGRILSEQLLLTDPRIDVDYRRSRLKGGDLLFSIRGSVGRMAIVPDHLENANITQDTARLSLRGLDARFVAAYLETEQAKRFVANHTIGVAVQGINLRDVRRIPIAKPTNGEDKIIADRIAGLDRKLSFEVAELEKLRLQKSGLMDDLLTGRVPVTPLLDGEAAHGT
nr:restriction endonuclease subunit S [uncultured Celeribacter sp.]